MMRLILFFFLAILCWACQKEGDSGFTGSPDPVFSVGYRVDNSDTATLIAGVNRVYHFTDFRSDDVLVALGFFAPVSCPDGSCPGSLHFEVRNIQSGNVFNANLLIPRTLQYKTPTRKDSLHIASIVWIDTTGQRWESNLVEQDNTAFFEIVTSEAYTLNEKGQRTQKMYARYACRLGTVGSAQTRLFKGMGTIAVALP
jgi:hypothetical protein